MKGCISSSALWPWRQCGVKLVLFLLILYAGLFVWWRNVNLDGGSFVCGWLYGVCVFFQVLLESRFVILSFHLSNAL